MIHCVQEAELVLRNEITLLCLFPRLDDRIIKRLGESNRQRKTGHAEQTGEFAHRRTVRVAASESKPIGAVRCVGAWRSVPAVPAQLAYFEQLLRHNVFSRTFGTGLTAHWRRVIGD